MNPTIIVPRVPTSIPALEKARGIARIPDPREAFKRFAIDCPSLEEIKQ